MRLSSSVVFRKTLQFESVAINLPPTRTVNDWRQMFTLKTWLMRPYPGNLSEEQPVYNLRQSDQEK